MRHYYAVQSPRGFANEMDVHRFETRAERDTWVTEHKDDGDCNSATRGARICAAREARSILARRGDHCTTQYNQLVAH